MPGRLLMDQQGQVGSHDPKKDRSQAQDGEATHKRDFAQMQQSDSAKDNTSNGQHTTNGLPVKQPTTNGQTVALHTAAADTSDPPLLVNQEWRTGPNNKSMGVMIERLAQQCFVDLNDTLNKMSELPSSQGGQANGVIPHTVDKSEPSLTRKRTLMEFANNQRDRFIKTLVLSDWARNAQDMAKLIDINVWQRAQFTAQQQAIGFIGTIKHDVSRAKMPNPNIEGAMEVLATGKGEKWPDLGYLPPKRLSAKRLLKTLKTMNVALATRLNLHEELPAHFNQFTIANGRATFHVPGEFDVDVSIADEDPSTPYYFIDAKFLFTPTPSLSDDGLRNILEARTNEALASKGLQGCFDFLHNFVLTHKINVFKQQAAQIYRERWFDCLQIQTHRRTLTIQYWKGLPGPKSWIEFGVSIGKSQDKRSHRPPVPHHSVRWFRRKQEIQDETISIDWTNLAFGDILDTAVAKHISWQLSTIQERLQQLSGTSSKLQTQLHTSDSAPDECSLSLSLSGLRAPIFVRYESVTGQISISPPTRNAAHIERYLNSDPNADPARSLVELLCRSVEDRVVQAANSARWHVVDKSMIGNQPNLKALFGEDVVRRNLFRCSAGWGEQWALCITYSLAGEKWWVVRLDSRNDQGKTVRFIGDRWALSETVPLTYQGNISRASMLQMERAAEAEVSFAVLAQQLSAANIPHRTERLSSLTRSEGPVEPLSTDLAVYLRLSPKKQKTGSQKQPYDAMGVASWIRVSPRGCMQFANEVAEMRHEIRLTIDSGKLQSLREHLTSSQSRDTEVAMNASGALALTLRTPFGRPFVDDICRVLTRCTQLDTALKVSKSMRFHCKALSLSKYSFTYGGAQEFTATLTSEGTSSPVSKLKLEPTDSNPHMRIRVVLEKMFNQQENGFFALGFSMNMTLPLLQAFDTIESSPDNRSAVTVHSHSPTQYSICFKAPLSPCKFSVKAFWNHTDRAIRQREYFYQVTLDEAGSLGLAAEAKNSLIQLSRSQDGPGWFGNQKGGFVSDVASIGEALQKFATVVRSSPTSYNDVPVKKQDTPGVDVKAEPEAQSKTFQPQKPPQHKATQGQQQKPKTQQGQGSRPQYQNGTLKQEVIELD